MKVFNMESEEFLEFQLTDSEEVYRVPLAGSMPYKTALLSKGGFEGQVEMLRAYIGDVVDTLPVKVLADIINMWFEQSNNTGASVGESSASES